MTYSTGRPGGARRDLIGMAGEVSVPEAGMVVLLLDIFFLGEASLPAIWRSFILSGEVLENKEGDWKTMLKCIYM